MPRRQPKSAVLLTSFRTPDHVREFVPSRCCGEGRRNRFSERRFKNGDVLLNGGAAHADARDQLALAGEWRSAAHGTKPSPVRDAGVAGSNPKEISLKASRMA
jgi:hypothetical protein